MSVTYIYNSSTVNLFVTEDLGSITSTPTTEDYGSISAAHTQEENYYEVQYVGDVTPFGTATIGGSASTVKQNIYPFASTGRFKFIFQEASSFFIHAWIGSGSLFEIGGGLERIVAPYLGADPLEGITLFNTSGSAGESFSTIYTIEDTTTLSTEDYGSVSVGGSSVDYGQVNTFTTAQLEYGTVSDVFSVPYEGTISITGSGAESFTESGYVGTGSYGGFSGSASISIPRRYEGSGSLFSVGGGEEQNVYRWVSLGQNLIPSTILVPANDTTILDQSSKDDVFLSSGGTGTGSTGGFNIGTHLRFGQDESGSGATGLGRNIQTNPVDARNWDSIKFSVIRGNGSNGGDAPSTSLNLSLRYQLPGETGYTYIGRILSYFSITGQNLVTRTVDLPDIVKVDGVIFRIRGAGTPSSDGSTDHYGLKEFTVNVETPTPVIKLTGGTTSANSFRLQGPIYIEGGADHSTAFRNVSTGSLFGFSGGDESVTRDYDEDNVLVFSTQDYGSVSASATTTADYGSVTSINTGYSDLGSVIYGQTTYSTTGGFTLSGSADTQFITKPEFTGSGSLFAIGGEANSFIPNWVATGLFGITGSSTSRVFREYESSGALITSGGEANSHTVVYNDSISVTFSTEDRGLITSAVTTSEDLGVVTQDSNSVDNGQVVFLGAPFGGMTLSGTGGGAPLRTFVYTGTASITTSGAATNFAFVPGPWRGDGLFAITGGDIAHSNPRAFQGFGSLSLGEQSTEKATKDYSDSTIDVFSTEDRGLVSASATSTEDQGLVTNNAALSDLGSVSRSQTDVAATANIVVSGSAVTANPRKLSYVAVGGGILFTISGGDNKFVPGYIGSGSISLSGNSVPNFSLGFIGDYAFNIVGGNISEEITKDYNNDQVSWDFYHETEFGTLTTNPQAPRDNIYPVGESAVSLPNSTQDFGLVSDTNLTRYYNFGSVSVSADSQSTAGTFTFSGTAVPEYKPEFAQTGTGLFAITGFAPNSFFPTWNAFGTFTATGDAVTNFSLSNPGTGALFANGIAGEAITSSYNLSSIDSFTADDHGQIASPLSNVIVSTDVPASDNTFLDQSTRVDVFFDTGGTGIGANGGFNIGEHLRFGKDTNASGSVGTQRSIQTNPTDTTNWESLTFQVIRGNSQNGGENPDTNEDLRLYYSTPSTGNTYILLGTILANNSAIGDSLVNVTLNLPVSARGQDVRFAIISTGTSNSFYEGFDHYGLKQITINEGVPDTVDYEYVTELATEAEDHGSIFYGNQSNIPFGLFRITGAAETAGLRRPIISGSGGITLSGDAVKQFAPNWNTTGLFAITGSATTPYSLREVSTGTLFAIGDTSHRVVFDYNIDSDISFTTEDRGLIAGYGTFPIPEDYGSLTAPLTGGEVDNGYVVFNASNGDAFGGITISGSVDDEFKPEFAQIGTGLFAIAGSGTDSFFPNWNGSGTISTSGGDGYNFSLLHPGSGTLFSNGIAGEAITKHYNISSADIYSTVDYGNLTTVATSTDDYQSVTDPGTSVNLDFGNLFTRGQTNEPFGLFRITGSAQTAKILRGVESGSGSLFAIGGAAETFQLEYTTTGLFRFSGSAVQKSILRNISTGTLFAIGGAAEAVVFDYNQSSITSFISTDNGLVSAAATSTEDYGSLTAPLTGGEVDNGFVVFNSVNGIPFGSITISGSAQTVYKPQFAQTGTGLFAITGQAQDSFFPNWNGSGSVTFSGGDGYNFSLLQPGIGRLFTNGIAGEAITKHYNISSVDVYSTEDYGSIATTATTTDDYQSVTDPGTSVNLDFGNIITQGQTNEPFGLFQISGAAVTAGLRKPSFNGSGVAFVFRGAAESFSLEYTTTGLFGFSGSAVPKAILRNISTGTLFTVGGAAEAIVYDYSQSSIEVFSTTDNGSVASNATTTQDNGSLTAPLTGGEVDNGFIVFNATNGIPFGGITIGSAADTVYAPEFGQVGDGLFAITGAGADQFIPNWVGSGALQTSGGDGYNLSLLQITTGGLFAFGGSAEAAVKHYNISSRDIYSTVDYGALTATPTSTDDYQSVTDPNSSSNLDFGNLITQGQTNEPFGLFQISGAADTAKILNISFVGSGSLFTTSGAADSLTSNPPENTVLFTFAGSTVPNFSFSQPANAFLTLDIESEERRVYHYNEDTVVTFGTEDLGLISNAATTTEDNGQLTDLVTEYDARGLIIYDSTVRSASGTITIGGAVTPDFIAENAHNGSGTITLSNSAADQFIPNWVGTGLFGFSGGDGYNFSLLQITTGGLFTNGIGGEAVTKHYNISSTATFTTADYGALSGTPSTTTDYGTVTTAYSDVEDFGLITVTQSLDPFGLFQISGSADTFFQPFRGSESTVLFQFSGTRAFEQFIPNWNASGTITLSGTAGQVAYRNFPYAGTGALFGNGIGGEAVVKDYSATSIVPFNTEDFGQISSVPTTTSDYGQITEGSTQDLDYRYIWEYPSYGIPFGTITISGAVNGTGSANFIRAPYAAFGNFTILSNVLSPMEEAFAVEADASGVIYLGIASAGTDRTRAYDGSGSLFAASGAAESKTTNKPESTVLFAVSGSGDPPIITLKFFGGGTITLSGAAETPRARDYVGSGTLFAIGGAAESKTSDEEFTGLYTFSGTAEPIIRTRAFQGSGQTTISGTAVERQLDHYTGSGVFQVTGIASAQESYAPAAEIGSGSLFSASGAAESKTSNPPENTILYTFAGSAEPIIRTRAFQGSGTINISGQLGLKVTLHYYGSGGITISGTVGESFTPATEVGSGSITISGTKDESFTKGNYTGSGSIILSGAAVERQLDHYTGSGTTTISGVAGIKLIVIITGGGSLFSTGGAAESKTTNKPESTVLFAVSGVVGESFGKGNYNASGTSTFSGAGIEKQTDDYVGTGSATLSGTAGIKLIIDFETFGNLFTTGGAAEAAAVDYESVGLFSILGSANEAIVPFIPPGSGSVFFSGAGVEKQTDDYVGTGSTTLSGQATDIKLSYGHQGTGGITLSGSAVERQTDDYVGTGSLFATSGAAESKTSNPPENTVLFSFSGTAAESATFDEVSAGGTIVLSGQATNVRFNRGWEGSGTATFSGSAVERQTDDYVGSGTLFAASGAAESKTSNPPENIVLYTFSGTAGDQKLTFSEVASGTITLFGSAVERQLDHYTGSGVFTLSGAAETPRSRDWVGSGTIIKFSARQGTLYAKVVDLPEFSGLFSISGTADTDRSRDYVGSGSLFSTGGAAESKTTNKPESTVLFNFSGTATESRTNDYVGSGSLFTVGGAAESATVAEESTGLFILSGAADTDRSRAYAGSGTLFGFSGAAESATVSEDATGLFTISGAAETPRARDYVGSGSLFAIGGASESKATNYPSIGLFQISGTAGIKLIIHYSGSGTITLSGNAAEAFVRPTYVGSGSFGGFSGSATESKTNDEEFTGTTTISGEATDIKLTFGYRGSGSLFTASGTGESATVDYENTVLFTFTGGGTEEFVPGGFSGIGQVTISGDAATELRIFQPEFTFVTII